MLGTIVNSIAIIAGALFGVILKKGIPERIKDTMMHGIGLCVLYIGISGALKGENTLILIISMIVGTLIGEGIDLQDKVERLGKCMERAVKRLTKHGKEEETDNSFANAFVTTTLVVCVGAMAIVGSLESGLQGQHDILFSKAVLDCIIAVMFASAMGIGVMFSAIPLFIYQGAITILAGLIAPYLTETTISEMTCVGSVIMMGLALNMLGLSKFKVSNFIPAVFIPILLCMFM